MKVLVQYIVIMKDGSKQFGRNCWIGKDEEGNLTFSTIYVNEETACDSITEVELEYLHKKASETGCFHIINIIR